MVGQLAVVTKVMPRMKQTVSPTEKPQSREEHGQLCFGCLFEDVTDRPVLPSGPSPGDESTFLWGKGRARGFLGCDGNCPWAPPQSCGAWERELCEHDAQAACLPGAVRSLSDRGSQVRR